MILVLEIADDSGAASVWETCWTTIIDRRR